MNQPMPSNNAEVTPHRRRELLDELRGVIEEANSGDEVALAAVGKILQETPTLSRFFADLADKVEQEYVKRISSGSPLDQKALPVRLEVMRGEIADPAASPLERLVAERVTAAWLELHYANLLYMQNLPNLGLSEDDYYQKRLDRLNKRYLAAIKSLAQVRKLLKPNIQVNIGDKQINTAGNPPTSQNV